MADDRYYRVQVRYDGEEDDTFTAWAPELDLSATADTRAEALTLIEDAIDARVHEAAEAGTPLPPTADDRVVEATIELPLSASLHRALIFEAERAGMAPAALAAELLARGVGMLEGRVSANRGRQEEASEEQSRGAQGDRGGRRRGRRREGYRPELDDKDNFRDYLRKMEKGGGRKY